MKGTKPVKKKVKKSKPAVWYKVLGPNGEPVNGGYGDWLLPTKNKPGDWMPKIDDPVACQRGYHLTNDKGLSNWIRSGYRVFLAEGRGQSSADGNPGTKRAYAEARLLKEIGTVPEDYYRHGKKGTQIIAELSNPKKYAAEQKRRNAKEEERRRKEILREKKLVAIRKAKEAKALKVFKGYKAWATKHRRLFRRIGWSSDNWRRLTLFMYQTGVKKPALFWSYSDYGLLMLVCRRLK